MIGFHLRLNMVYESVGIFFSLEHKWSTKVIALSSKWPLSKKISIQVIVFTTLFFFCFVFGFTAFLFFVIHTRVTVNYIVYYLSNLARFLSNSLSVTYFFSFYIYNFFPPLDFLERTIQYVIHFHSDGYFPQLSIPLSFIQNIILILHQIGFFSINTYMFNWLTSTISRGWSHGVTHAKESPYSKEY